MFSWTEIYIGQNSEEFYRLTDILGNGNIRFKTKITDTTRNRMSRDVLFGGDPLIINTAGMKASSFREYRIYVKKDQKYEACELIEKYKREKNY